MSPFRVLLLPALVLPLLSQQYRFEEFFTGENTYPSSINNIGVIVGAADGSFVRYPDGRLQTGIRFPRAQLTIFASINNFGTIAGYFYGQGRSKGMIIKDGAVTVLEPWSQINSINSKEDFVGVLTGYRGAMSVGGIVTPIDYPGAWETWPTGIGADGTVVGGFRRSGVDYGGFLRGPKGNFLELTIANGNTLTPLGINSAAGKIVGCFFTEGPRIHGFVYDYRADLAALNLTNASMVRTIQVQVIDYPGALDTTVKGINGKGAITGDARFDLPGQYRAVGFLGTPALPNSPLDGLASEQ